MKMSPYWWIWHNCSVLYSGYHEDYMIFTVFLFEFLLFYLFSCAWRENCSKPAHKMVQAVGAPASGLRLWAHIKRDRSTHFTRGVLSQCCIWVKIWVWQPATSKTNVSYVLKIYKSYFFDQFPYMKLKLSDLFRINQNVNFDPWQKWPSIPFGSLNAPYMLYNWYLYIQV